MNKSTIFNREAMNAAQNDIMKDELGLFDELAPIIPLHKLELEKECLIKDYMEKCSYTKREATVAANNVLGINI
jgi:hypothetical protein